MSTPRRPGPRSRPPSDSPRPGPFSLHLPGEYGRTMPTERSAAIRVVIADDDQLYLSSLRELIDRQPELAVVGSARDGLEAIELVEALSPEAAVIDLHMPRMGGVETLDQ